MGFFDLITNIVFEPSIVNGNLSFAIAMVIALYKKKKDRNNVLWFCLHIVILYIVLSLLTGILFYLPLNFSYTFYLIFLLASAFYVFPRKLFNNTPYKPAIINAMMMMTMHFVLGEMGGGIPVLFQNVVNGAQFDAIIRNVATATIILFALFISKVNLRKIKNLSTIATVFLITYSVLELLLTVFFKVFNLPYEFNVGLFRIFAFMILVILDYLAYYMIYKICKMNDEKNQLRIRNMELERINDLMTVSDQNLQKLRELKHDEKNHYAYMKYLIENKQYPELEDFFASYADGVLEPISYISCNNKILCSILNVEYSKAKASSIQLDVKLAVPDVLPFSSVDLVSLISNLIDNAIEACKSYAIKDPVITVRIREYRQYLMVDVKNQIPEDVTIEMIEGVRTTKEDKALHGYGKKIVKKIVRLYDGTYLNKAEKGSYEVQLMLKKPQTREE